MDLFYALILCGLVIGAPVLVMQHETNKTKEQTVIMCIEKPKQCKKQYDFYKMRDELKNEQTRVSKTTTHS